MDGKSSNGYRYRYGRFAFAGYIRQLLNVVQWKDTPSRLPVTSNTTPLNGAGRMMFDDTVDVVLNHTFLKADVKNEISYDSIWTSGGIITLKDLTFYKAPTGKINFFEDFFFYEAGELHFFDGTTTISGAFAPVLDQAYHIDIVWAGGVMSIQIDSVVVASDVFDNDLPYDATINLPISVAGNSFSIHSILVRKHVLDLTKTVPTGGVIPDSGVV